MKRLLLLRHAKAVAGGPKTGDHGRALADRGRADAPRMGSAMQHNRYVPQRVLCSTAKRTVETWERLAPELESAPEVEFLDELYLAPANVITNVVRRRGDTANALLIVGHNPGLEDCARALSRKPQSGSECDLFEAMSTKFPTAALAVLDFPVDDWAGVAPGEGTLTDFLRPKDLTSD